MGKKETLEQIIRSVQNNTNLNFNKSISSEIRGYIKQISSECEKKKGVYTVLTTLLYYKYLHPEQDIRLHQTRFANGFSGRSFDTQNITPILKKMNLPAMSESGWLTRSLEQPYPYDLNYNGAIGTLKIPFLKTLDYVQKNPSVAYDLLKEMLSYVCKIAEENKIQIIPLEHPEHLTIDKIIHALEEHFLTPYGTHNGAKLPVLALHSIYSSLINELKRYDNCYLAPLSSLTASDRTNKASGDIEIFRDGKVFESIEIKLDKKINAQIIRVAEDKIYKYNPSRYYILSVLGIEESEKSEIESVVFHVLNSHGCQIIINGLIPTIKYYLRLITNLHKFIKNYSASVQSDLELQKIHKEKWNELIEKYTL